MNPKLFDDYGFITIERREKKVTKSDEDLTLTELKDKIFKITKDQKYLSECGLSEEIVALAFRELERMKDEVKAIMHKKVDEL
jgi:hypothetical protein